MDQIVEMQQVVIEDREEEERLRQLQELATVATKVRTVQDRPKRNVWIQEVQYFCPIARKNPKKLIAHCCLCGI